MKETAGTLLPPLLFAPRFFRPPYLPPLYFAPVFAVYTESKIR